jgi:hypothetical protein
MISNPSTETMLQYIVVGLSSYDTLITTITATIIIISTRKNILLLYQKAEAMIQWMFYYGFKYTISRIRPLLFNTCEHFWNEISRSKEFRTNIQCGSIQW